jgi:hypothetical protein
MVSCPSTPTLVAGRAGRYQLVNLGVGKVARHSDAPLWPLTAVAFKGGPAPRERGLPQGKRAALELLILGKNRRRIPIRWKADPGETRYGGAMDVERAVDLYAYGRTLSSPVSEAEGLITSTRRPAAVCGVTRFAVRAWIDRGLLPEPPWTPQQLLQVRDTAETGPGPQAPHGTRARWSNGCACVQCRQAHSDTLRSYGRARARDRLHIEVRRQLLDAIYVGQPVRQVLRDLGLTPNQVWGLRPAVLVSAIRLAVRPRWHRHRLCSPRQSGEKPQDPWRK